MLPSANVQHPCKSTGIARIQLGTKEEGLESLAKKLSVVLGRSPTSTSSSEITWSLETPNNNEFGMAELVLRVQPAAVGVEISKVEFFVEAGEQNGGSIHREAQFGQVRFVPQLRNSTAC